MVEPTATITSPACRPGLPPLQSEGRTREVEVERQARALLAAPASEWKRRLAIADRNHPDWLQEETLAALLRECRRRGEDEAGWRIGELLIERSAKFLSKQIRCFPQLSPTQVEDCIRDAQMQMLEQLIETSGRQEFWEVRFWRCLRFLAMNCVRRYRLVANHAYEPMGADEDGKPGDPLEKVAAIESLSPDDRIAIAQALQALDEHERVAFVLTHWHNWTQSQIAGRLQVTDRTVRNYLTSAEKKLDAWRSDAVH